MDYFDAKFTDYIVDNLVNENIEIKKSISPYAEFDFAYAEILLDKYKTKVSATALEAYGWTCENVKYAIVKSLPDEYKAPLKKQFDNEGEM